LSSFPIFGDTVLLLASAGLKAALRSRQLPGSPTLDDEFYKARAQQLRELADKADPLIRKRLLDLAGNYDQW
jgi:hypothetical protein